MTNKFQFAIFQNSKLNIHEFGNWPLKFGFYLFFGTCFLVL
jgi:hypothetical protein